MLTLRHTKKYALFGAMCLLVWMCAVTIFLNHEAIDLSGFPIPLEGILNISLLLALVLFLRCVVFLFRDRPLLQANKQGLYLNLPPKNRGVIPWRSIAGFSRSPDGRVIYLYLQGTWDIPDHCGERFDIQTDERGKRRIPLYLYRKAGNLAQALQTLEQWHRSFYTQPARGFSPETDEAASRKAASLKGRGISLLLVFLHILRANFWTVAVLLYLLTAGALTEYVALPLAWVLPLLAIPFLFGGWLLRRLLAKGIAALQRCRDSQRQRSVGL